jgi:ATP phosphoribosyltransferase
MNSLSILIPKGRMFANISLLFSEAGIPLNVSERSYIPYISDSSLSAKIMKPQNIAPIVSIGRHDAGFAGHDWIVEEEADVEEVLDLGFDSVDIVAAAPAGMEEAILKAKKVVVATEYAGLASRWLAARGYDFTILRSWGATEVFPPDDADMIVDNSATGTTLREHGLSILDVILKSSTRFIASKQAMRDPWKKEKILELALLFKAIIDGGKRVMLEMNVPSDKMGIIIPILPCMKSPTVSSLYGESGYAVKIAIPKKEAAALIPRLKKLGASDILEYELRKAIV